MMNRPGWPGIGTILRAGVAIGMGGGKTRFGTGIIGMGGGKTRFGTGIIGMGRGGGCGTGFGAGRTCADSAAGDPAARQASRARKRQPGISDPFPSEMTPFPIAHSPRAR